MQLEVGDTLLTHVVDDFSETFIEVEVEVEVVVVEVEVDVEDVVVILEE